MSDDENFKEKSPFQCWEDFFAKLVYSPNNPILKCINQTLDWLRKDFLLPKKAAGAHISPSKSLFKGEGLHQVLIIDWTSIPSSIKQEFCDINGNVLDDQISRLIDVISFAASEIASKQMKSKIIYIARLVGYTNLTLLKDVKADLVGHFISIRGNVVRVSSLKPICHRMVFNCASCNEEQSVVFPDGKFKAPIKCIAPGCKSRVMIPNRSPNLAFTNDWQKIRIQEKLSSENIDSGRVPRTIECELTRDLVDTVVPGDVVLVSGLLKVLAADDAKGKSAQMYYTYIDTNSLQKLSSVSDSENTKHSGKDFLEHSKSDLKSINEIMNFEGNLFLWLAHSLCPNIFGHEMVKAGLLLSLFGGRKRIESEANLLIRSDSHVLLVGDPGMGKSQMLLSTVKLAPRGVYVSGNMASTAGLTVTVCKDPDTGDTVLEAGALVLGDQGVCCIDEFDKMTDHQALLEAMEQQRISVAKAGMICSLPCRTSVIAAANPIGGHYNKSKSASENLRMDPALLSRFDLIFILLDNPNEQMDKFLSDHIMLKRNSGKSDFLNHEKLSFKNSEDPSTTKEQMPLKERLIYCDESQIEPIPAPLLRKYISYARTYSHPLLSEEAAGVLQSFYLWIRKNHRYIDSTPITTRLLESLIRLAEARARCELRDIVLESDALDVVDIMKESLSQSLQNNSNESQNASKRSGGKGIAKMSRNLLSALCSCNKQIFTLDEIKALNNNAPDTLNLIDLLNNQGLLLKKGGGLYQLTS